MVKQLFSDVYCGVSFVPVTSFKIEEDALIFLHICVGQFFHTYHAILSPMWPLSHPIDKQPTGIRSYTSIRNQCRLQSVPKRCSVSVFHWPCPKKSDVPCKKPYALMMFNRNTWRPQTFNHPGSIMSAMLGIFSQSACHLSGFELIVGQCGTLRLKIV